MTFEHAKAHWLKYYLGVGAVWAAYNMWTYANQRNLGDGIRLVALWPLDLYHTVTGSAATAAPAIASGS